MSYSQLALVQRVRDLTLDIPWLTVTTGAVTTTSQTSISVSDGTRWDEGAILEFQDTGELCWVRSVSGNTLTVLRGYNGTSKSTYSSGVTIVRDPFFSITRIKDDLNLLLVELFPWVYKVKLATLTTDPDTQFRGYLELPTDFMQLIRVQQVKTTELGSVPQLYFYGARGSGYPVAAGPVPTSLCSTGFGIKFPRGTASQTDDIEVTYAAKYTAAVSGPDYTDFSDGEMADILAYGTAARLLEVSETPRVTTLDTQMGDASVVPGARRNQGIYLGQRFKELRGIQHEELRRNNPLMPASKMRTSSTVGTPAGAMVVYP